MRFGLVAVAASLVAHVAIMQAIGAVDPPPPRKPPTPTKISITSVPPAVVDAIDVDFIAPPIAPSSAAPPAIADRVVPQRVASHARPTAAAATAAIAAAASSSGGVEVAAVDEPPSKPGMLSMRSRLPRLTSFYLPEGLDIGGAPPPPPMVPSGELQPSGGGTFETEHGGFTANVARDGRVKFKDKPAFSFHLAVPNPKVLAKAAARGLEDWFDDPGKAIRMAARDPAHDAGRPIGGGAPEQKDLPAPMVYVPLVGGSAEITDWVMRKAGMDPYASAKRDYLDATREERTAMRIVQDARQLARADATMRSNLARLWRHAELDAAARRTAIFELWDECLEDGDEEVVDAGNRARAAVIGFVRGHLPAGSPDAFTADELAALNAKRTSKALFAPY